MKHLIKQALFLAAFICVVSCSANERQVTIKGRVNGFVPGEIPAMALYNEVTDTLTVDGNGAFPYDLDLDKHTNIFFAGLTQDMIWVSASPGNRISFTIENVDTPQMQVVFTGDRADVNNYINAFKLQAESDQWRQEKIAEHTFAQHKARVDAMINELQPLLDKIEDPQERAELQMDLDITRDNFYFRYIWSTAAIKGLPADNDPDFVAYAEAIDLNDQAILDKNEPVKRNAADARLRWEMRRDPVVYNGSNSYQNKLLAIGNLITDPQIADKMAGETITGYFRSGGDDFLSETFEMYRKVNSDPDALSKNEAIYAEMSKLGEGRAAPEIPMVDAAGNKIMLSDLRGKNLYIDIWATWCGPCMNEIPYVEKLHEKYKDSPNLECVSISVDHNTKAWEDMMADAPHGWPDYLAVDGFKGPRRTKYGVSGSPRFMLIDQDGNIVSVNAPRPSSTEIEE